MFFDLTGRGLKEEKMVRGTRGNYSRKAINQGMAIIRRNTVALRPAQKLYKKTYDLFQFWPISVQCRHSLS